MDRDNQTRHCERSEAIQVLVSGPILDCRAGYRRLAMTAQASVSICVGPRAFLSEKGVDLENLNQPERISSWSKAAIGLLPRRRYAVMASRTLIVALTVCCNSVVSMCYVECEFICWALRSSAGWVQESAIVSEVNGMDAGRAIEILERQRETARELQSVEKFSARFKKWQRDTEIAIEHIFSSDSRNTSDFSEISYSLFAFSTGTPDLEFQRAYVRGLEEADAVLASMIDEIQEYSTGELDNAVVTDNLNLVERICLRFHSSARQLRSRHGGRSTIEIEDEYDVQDLLHAFLKLHFDDIRPEEWTPSYAGRSSRVDFLLKNEGIVVETKKTRASLSDGNLGEELIIDRARYETHPDCNTLVCFVYDPEGRIGNPYGLEKDLELHSGDLKVRVIVAPKS